MTLAVETLNKQLACLEHFSLPTRITPTTKASVKLGDKDILVERTYTEWVAEAQNLQRMTTIFERMAGEYTPTVHQQLTLLERQTIALIYRANVHKPKCKTFEELKTGFSEILIRYKQNPNLYPGGDGKLTAMDNAQIEEACLHFPVAVEALMRRNPANTCNDPWTTAFVKFCLRSPGASQIDAMHWVKIFFELPQKTDELMACTLDKRLGAIDPKLLQILTVNGTKALYMKVHDAWQKIQGREEPTASPPNCINSNNPGVNLSFSNICREMGAKRYSYGCIETFQNAGILNWDSGQLGSLNATTGQVERIDVTAPNWMYNLPTWKSAELHEVQARYPDQVHWPDNLPHEQRFALVMCASREKANLDIVNNHAYFEVVLPEPNQPGGFRILPFGFQPPTLPKSDLDRLKSLQQTQPCILHYPDESSFLSQREHYSELFPMTSEEFNNLQNVLGHYVQKSREGKEVFQATGSNCGKHAQKVFDDTLGQRFYEPFATLAKTTISGQDVRIHNQIKQITKALNDEALESLSSELAEELVNKHDFKRMSELISLCLTTFSYTLKEKEEIQAYKISAAEVETRIVQLYQKQLATDEMLKADLKKLIQIAVASQQFYKISIFDVEVGNPILGPIFRFIQGIQWEWLRNLLFRVLCFLLGSWRGYTYQKANGTKTARVCNNPLHGRALNLPAQAFNRPDSKAQYQKQIDTILDHFPA